LRYPVKHFFYFFCRTNGDKAQAATRNAGLDFYVKFGFTVGTRALVSPVENYFILSVLLTEQFLAMLNGVPK
jgi:hypothetical protein